MRRALEYVKAFDGVIAQHAEEPRLTEGAQMHEGARLGRRSACPAGRRSPRRRSSPGTCCSPSTSAPGCTSATSPPPAASRSCAGPSAAGDPGHRRGDPAPPAADRRAAPAAYDPVFKVNPPLRTAGRRGRAARGPGRRRDRRGRHRPRPARRAGQGVRVGVRPAGHARAGDGAVHCGRRRCSSQLGWDGIAERMSRTPARIAGLSRATATTRRRRRAGQPHAGRPGGAVDGRAGRAGQPQPQHAVRRAASCPAGWCATFLRGRADGARRKGGPVMARGDAGAGGRPDVPRRGVRQRRRDVRRGGLHHRHDRLPGDADRPVLPPPGRRADRAAHRQHRRQRRGRRVGPDLGGRLRGARPGPAAVELALHRRRWRTAWPPRASSASAASTPAR